MLLEKLQLVMVTVSRCGVTIGVVFNCQTPVLLKR